MASNFPLGLIKFLNLEYMCVCLIIIIIITIIVNLSCIKTFGLKRQNTD